MKSVVICGNQAANRGLYTAVQTIEIEGMPVTIGLTEIQEPNFDPQAPANSMQVFMKVRALSCNYRDKGLILKLSQECSQNGGYVCIGSEFVGEVIAIGSEVTRFEIGDRVMADNRYPDVGVPGLLPGIPTNFASKRYRALHEAKLIKVPPEMPDEVAAAFALGAQTSYSMIRTLDIKEGKNVLVTASTSNTSLFAIRALKNRNSAVYAITTSKKYEDVLTEMGVKEVIHIDPNLHSLRENKRIEEIVTQTGGFDYVIDPFFDLYLNKVLHTIAMGGKYITCGIADQYSQITGKPFPPENASLREIILYTSSHNIHILGNCLGQTEDLRLAIEDYRARTLDVTIDSVWHGEQVAAFFNRTYNAHNRLGKVVYCYND